MHTCTHTRTSTPEHPRNHVCEHAYAYGRIWLRATCGVAQELMLRGAGLTDVLRLMVAMSEAGHGIPRKAFDMLRAEVLTTYGHEHALTLGALEKAGEAHARGRAGLGRLLSHLAGSLLGSARVPSGLLGVFAWVCVTVTKSKVACL